jgi:nephrocystin-3
VAIGLNNLGNLYASTGRTKQAEAAHVDALEIRERIAAKNPSAYNSDLAGSLANLGSVYMSEDRLPEADVVLGRALGLYKELALSNRKVHKASEAKVLVNLVALDMRTGQLRKAELEAKECVEISSEMWKENPVLYGDVLAERELLLAQILLLEDSDRPTVCALLANAAKVAQDERITALAIEKTVEFCQ